MNDAFAALLWRWVRAKDRVRTDLMALALAAVATAVLSSVELLAGRGSGASVPAVDWR